MSDRDDDFLDHGGDEFNADSEEFHIPEDPHQEDDDFLTQVDEGFDLSESDVLDMSGQDSDENLLAGNDALDLEEPEHDSGLHSHREEVEEYEDAGEAEQPDISLGWKAWTGLALAAILAAGGATYWAMPDSGGSQGSQASQSLPTPPPPPAPTPTDTAGDNQVAQQQMTSRATESSYPRRENPPVAVSPFPESDGAVGVASPGQSSPESAGLVDQNIGGARNGLPPVPVAGNGDGGGPGSAITPQFTVDDMDQVDGGDSGNPVAAPVNRNAIDRELGYERALSELRLAAGELSVVTQTNRRQLADVRADLDQYQREARREINDLDERVKRLEQLIEAGRTVDNQAENVSTNSVSSNTPVEEEHSWQPPRSPSEIKALQRKLQRFNYRPGLADGVLGAQTRWAIKRLQQEHGLEVTGWLDQETLEAIENPKRYSGTYENPENVEVARSQQRSSEGGRTDRGRNRESAGSWFVRGVTTTRAVVYRPDGLSYAVRVGTEIPGMGQVTRLDPEQLHVVTANGVITRR